MSFDVTWKYEVIKSKIDSFVAKFNQIDVLINNAGVTFRGEVNLLLLFEDYICNILKQIS